MIRKLANFLLLSAFLILCFNITNVIAQQEMTLEQWQAEMDRVNKRIADAEARKTKCEQDMAAVQQQIKDAEDKIAAVEAEMSTLFGVSEQELAAAAEDVKSKATDLLQRIDGLLALSPEELYERQDEVAQLRAELEALKLEDAAAMEEVLGELSRVEAKLRQLENKVPRTPPKTGRYTVVRGDYLWKISGKSEVYSDPYKWIRIYTANRDQIKDPDLIYPRQQFDVPQQAKRSEYWVKRGDWLEKIAGSSGVYNDPFQWTKIYEANRDIIGEDPNVVYPHQILIIPGR